MASLKEMRNRIASVKATQKITKAMQMVAAAKLRRSQDAAQNARPYATRMAAVIANLAAGVSGPGAPRLLVGTGQDQRHLIVVATSDRGLAGGFNSSIVRAARERIAALIAQGKDVKLITVGKKSRDQLRRLYADRILIAIEAGSNEVETLTQEENDDIPEGAAGAKFICERTAVAAVSKWLAANGWTVVTSEIGYIAKQFPELTEAQRNEVGEFLHQLDEHDDVHRVWAAVK